MNTYVLTLGVLFHSGTWYVRTYTVYWQLYIIGLFDKYLVETTEERERQHSRTKHIESQNNRKERNILLMKFLTKRQMRSCTRICAAVGEKSNESWRYAYDQLQSAGKRISNTLLLRLMCDEESRQHVQKNWEEGSTVCTSSSIICERRTIIRLPAACFRLVGQQKNTYVRTVRVECWVLTIEYWKRTCFLFSTFYYFICFFSLCFAFPEN